MISIIVPIKNEGVDAVERFRRFAGRPDSELIIADGGACSETAASFEKIGAVVFRSPAKRGGRLAQAARLAKGDVLFFLHADSRPPAAALELIRAALAAGASAGAFSLAYEDATPVLRWIAWWANLRSRYFKLPFGDQGIFCRRDAYERAGGVRDLPVCDDVDFVRRIAKAEPFAVLPEKTVTSPRRYLERGAFSQVLRNWKVLAGYYAGVSPETLDRWYNAGQRSAEEEEPRRR
jgi:rSAM/selenodomain-associated transferase 2